MKTLPRKLLPLTLFGIAVTSLFSVQLAQAYIVTLEQIGANVEAHGSGAINLTGLGFQSSGIGRGAIIPFWPLILTGPAAWANTDVYIGFTGPTSFGSGYGGIADTGSGDLVGIRAGELSGLVVPQGYISGAPLSDSATFNNATFASLGVTPGTYTWMWGTGLENQNFTLVILGAARIPDGGSTVSLLGFALLGLTALRRKLRC